MPRSRKLPSLKIKIISRLIEFHVLSTRVSSFLSSFPTFPSLPHRSNTFPSFDSWNEERTPLDTTWQIRVVQGDREAGSHEVISVHNAMQSISSLTIGLVNEQPLEFTINLDINHTSRLLLESFVRNGNYRWNDTALRTIWTVARRTFVLVRREPRKGRKLICP